MEKELSPWTNKGKAGSNVGSPWECLRTGKASVAGAGVRETVVDDRVKAKVTRPNEEALTSF